jgi:hypothetical protein
MTQFALSVATQECSVWIFQKALWERGLVLKEINMKTIFSS